MARYRMVDVESGQYERIVADSPEEAIDEAKDLLRDIYAGDIGETTYWAEAEVQELVDGEWVTIDTVTVPVHPREPDCVSPDGTRYREHDWQRPIELVGGCKESPGVFSNGGGVVIRSVCVRCGTEVIYDTWARGPSTCQDGEGSIEYKPYSRAENLHLLN